jgi:hypothetical protein
VGDYTPTPTYRNQNRMTQDQLNRIIKLIDVLKSELANKKVLEDTTKDIILKLEQELKKSQDRLDLISV